MKALYYGDNLQVLRDSIATESGDLIYLDPPFNSSATYSVCSRGQSSHLAEWALTSAISGNSRSDKTFIGRIERGFDFLGYHFGLEGLTLAVKTIEQFVARAIRLYEQESGETLASLGLDCTRNIGSRELLGWPSPISLAYGRVPRDEANQKAGCGTACSVHFRQRMSLIWFTPSARSTSRTTRP